MVRSTCEDESANNHSKISSPAYKTADPRRGRDGRNNKCLYVKTDAGIQNEETAFPGGEIKTIKITCTTTTTLWSIGSHRYQQLSDVLALLF